MSDTCESPYPRVVRKKQRETELYSIDPQPERAYPMEQRLDLVHHLPLCRTSTTQAQQDWVS